VVVRHEPRVEELGAPRAPDEIHAAEWGAILPDVVLSGEIPSGEVPFVATAPDATRPGAQAPVWLPLVIPARAGVRHASRWSREPRFSAFPQQECEVQSAFPWMYVILYEQAPFAFQHRFEPQFERAQSAFPYEE
jgi:hypothetical protein